MLRRTTQYNARDLGKPGATRLKQFAGGHKAEPMTILALSARKTQTRREARVPLLFPDTSRILLTAYRG